jgi:hypothetical protein
VDAVESAVAAVTRILCAPVDMHPLAAAALARYAPGAEIVPISRLDGAAYWREISQRWDAADDLLIIEQDIEVTAGTISALTGCAEPWCVFAYKSQGWDSDGLPYWKTVTYSLGCTKFSCQIQRHVEVPAIQAALDDCPENCHGRWYHLDCHIGQQLHEAGYQPHVHGMVKHHHDYRPADPAPPLSETIRISGDIEEIRIALQRLGWKAEGLHV